MNGDINLSSVATINLRLGLTEIHVLRYQSCHQLGVVFLNLHRNETTSIQAGKRYILGKAATFYHFTGLPQRNLCFTFNDQQYQVDPNRIFTPLGIEKTLLENGPCNNELIDTVQLFSQTLISHLRLAEASVIVALHNNSDPEFSLSAFQPGGEYHAYVQKVSCSHGENPHNFFYVTSAAHFDYFKQLGWNVVLQNNLTSPDDGSLSIFCGQNNISYINIEAKLGQLNTQTRMINTLTPLISDLSHIPQRG